MGAMEEPIEERADGGDVAEELAPVLDRRRPLWLHRVPGRALGAAASDPCG
jgi:hypothetical protein